MSYKRPNPGRREREARKRHRRGAMSSSATNWEWLKLGHEHSRRVWSHVMCVDDSRKSITDAH